MPYLHDAARCKPLRSLQHIGYMGVLERAHIHFFHSSKPPAVNTAAGVSRTWLSTQREKSCFWDISAQVCRRSPFGYLDKQSLCPQLGEPQATNPCVRTAASIGRRPVVHKNGRAAKCPGLTYPPLIGSKNSTS
eukprot:scaffold300681_cov17-Tisochrysis_lutea.AAC.1